MNALTGRDPGIPIISADPGKVCSAPDAIGRLNAEYGETMVGPSLAERLNLSSLGDLG
jgi:hypothetical protein